MTTTTATTATTATIPDQDRYCTDPALAGPFENRLLYAMCRDHPGHDDPYVTAGKTIAIGRIYAAAPERGAGTGRTAQSLGDAIALRLSRSALDDGLRAIDFAQRFSPALLDTVVGLHALLVDEIAEATRGWSRATQDEGWSPRNQASFASKYLHFHRPNAFPIMDSFARKGLACAGLKGPFDGYARFCAAILRHVAGRQPPWTLRGIDTDIVAWGRIHDDRSGSHCARCGQRFIRRPRRQKAAPA